MNQKIFFLSDIEMGRGDITDDFNDDDILVNFLGTIAAQKENSKTVLVLNGDIFDFLKMNYKDKYPRYITEEISLWKLDQAFKAHPKVFKALQEFAKNKNNHIHFIIGNHDADLVWPTLQEKIQNKIGNKERITFSFQYQTPDIHAEHGHLQDPFFANNTKKPIINFKGKQILNLPWGAYACATHLVNLKRKFPKEEQLVPNPLALKSNPKFNSESKKTTLKLALRSLILDPIIHFNDPTYDVPYWGFFNHLLKYGFEFTDDEKFLVIRAKKVMTANPDKKIIVLGHAHILTESTQNEQKVLVTDTWRNEYDLRNGSTKKPKTYAEVIYADQELVSASLKEWK